MPRTPEASQVRETTNKLDVVHALRETHDVIPPAPIPFTLRPEEAVQKSREREIARSQKLAEEHRQRLKAELKKLQHAVDRREVPGVDFDEAARVAQIRGEKIAAQTNTEQFQTFAKEFGGVREITRLCTTARKNGLISFDILALAEAGTLKRWWYARQLRSAAQRLVEQRAQEVASRRRRGKLQA